MINGLGTRERDVPSRHISVTYYQTWAGVTRWKDLDEADDHIPDGRTSLKPAELHHTSTSLSDHHREIYHKLRLLKDAPCLQVEGGGGGVIWVSQLEFVVVVNIVNYMEMFSFNTSISCGFELNSFFLFFLWN